MYKLTRDEEGLLTTKLDCPVCENKYIFVEGENGSVTKNKPDDENFMISAKCTECGHRENFEGQLKQ